MGPRASKVRVRSPGERIDRRRGRAVILPLPGCEHGRGNQKSRRRSRDRDRPPARRDLDVAHLGAPVFPRVDIVEKVENRNGLVARLQICHSTEQVW